MRLNKNRKKVRLYNKKSVEDLKDKINKLLMDINEIKDYLDTIHIDDITPDKEGCIFKISRIGPNHIVVFKKDKTIYDTMTNKEKSVCIKN